MSKDKTRTSYDVRSYTLQANTPQALPSAREFLIISATDVTVLGFNLGDANGDMEQWPFGFAIGVKEGSTKARISSTIAQTVVIAMVDGDAQIKDNRFAPGAGSLPVTIADGASVSLGAKADAAATTDTGAFSLIALFKRLLSKIAATYSGAFSDSQALGGGAAGGTVVAAGTNVNGILVLSGAVSCRQDPNADYSISDGTIMLLRAFDGQVATFGSQFVIPAGKPLSYSMTGGGNMSVAYKVL